ncbi:MAG: HD-like signal output (HDOD) protein [Gammaproteobacteria bacterium]|jgi:HD-like signal output (HDOD) protein
MSDSAARAWLSSHKKPVPALDVLHQKALETLKSTTASLSDLADIISFDPGMSIALFEKMNDNRNGNRRPRLDSIHSLLGLMGIQAVTQFVNQFETMQSSELSYNTRQAYHQLMSRNFHLMHQTAQLIKLQGMDNTHDIQTAAMLHNAGEIYTCLFDFQHYLKYQQACLSNKLGAESAQSIFGYSFAELGRLLRHELNLPDLVREAQQESKNTSRKARTLQIAAEITQQAEIGWNHYAFTRSLILGAKYLGCSVASLRKKVLSTALEAARDFPIAGVFPAIAKAILLPTVEKPKPAVKEQPPVTSSLPFSDKIRALIKSPTATQTGIIELLIKELAEKLQLSRVVLMVLSKDGAVLSTRMSNGLGGQSPLLKLQIKVSQSGLIKSLITKPQSLWVKSANFKKYENLLPGSFRASCLSQNFFLMSLFIGKKPIGIFFCDSTKKLDEALYNTFKSNLMCTGKALTFLSQRAKK